MDPITIVLPNNQTVCYAIRKLPSSVLKETTEKTDWEQREKIIKLEKKENQIILSILFDSFEKIENILKDEEISNSEGNKKNHPNPICR